VIVHNNHMSTSRMDPWSSARAHLGSQSSTARRAEVIELFTMMLLARVANGSDAIGLLCNSNGK
jgi:hypothetical protein